MSDKKFKTGQRVLIDKEKYSVSGNFVISVVGENFVEIYSDRGETLLLFPHEVHFHAHPF